MKVLAFDIGISSIGWALVESGGFVGDDTANNAKSEWGIVDCGVRIFTKAENPKTGESLALPRRTARGVRRRLNRRKVRLNELKRLICAEFGLNLGDFMSSDGELPRAYRLSKCEISGYESYEKRKAVRKNSDTKEKERLTQELEKCDTNPYKLRTQALERKLTADELARVILHIAKHRGYGNKHAKESNDDESGRVKKAIAQNAKLMGEKRYKSVGEYLYKEFYKKLRDFSETQPKSPNNTQGTQEFINVRNKAESYARCVAQEELKSELALIFERQKALGWEFSKEKIHKSLETPQNSKDDDKLDFIEKVLEVAFWQRPLKSYADKVGFCTFFENEKRAAKDSPSAIEFVALTRIINVLANISKISGEIYGKEKINEILKAVLEKGEMSYKNLRKMLNLPEFLTFPKDSKLDYTKGEDAEKAKFIEFASLKKLKKALGESFERLLFERRAEFDEIATLIALNNDKQELLKSLIKFDLTDEQRHNLSELSLAKFINLSFKALNAILPYMRGEKDGECKRYDEAVTAAGLKAYGKNSKKGKELIPLKDYEPNLANPVVARALAEYRKLLNALLKKYGAVHKIHLEFTREAGASKKQRQEIEKAQRENFATNEWARKECERLELVGGSDMLKMKLWREQNETCIYSGKKITIEHLRDETALQIDHIYPYSRSFDDSYNNKVLVFSEQNQHKLNQTPYEAFGKDKEKWTNILNLSNKLPKSKKARITNTHFSDKEMGFLARNLVDTSYTARLVRDYTSECLEFLPLNENENTKLALGEKGSKRHIEVISGNLTAMMRHYWGLHTILNNNDDNDGVDLKSTQNSDKDRDNHLHHAIDAIIIAFINASTIKAFSDFKKTQEQNKAKFYAKQIAKSEFKAKRAFFAPCDDFRNKVKSKVLGVLGENGELNGGIFVSKPPRKRARGALHLETFSSLDDKNLLETYGGKDNAKEVQRQGVLRAIELGKIRQIGTKIASNGTMVRTDIFRHKTSGKFYGVPIYTMDFALGVLPNKAVVSGKDKQGIIKEWLEMDENYEFCFSLFKDDLILVQKKEMSKAELCYFTRFKTSGPSIGVAKHDNLASNLTPNQKQLFTISKDGRTIEDSLIAILNLKIFEKWQVSVLGKCEFKASANKPENRQKISLKSTKGRQNEG